jgi:uncharacterized protein (UPF0335 family)
VQLQLAEIMGFIIFALILVALVFLIRNSIKNKSDLGLIFDQYILGQGMFWLTFLLVVLYVAEALYTASAHVEGLAVRGQLPWFARFIMHFGINLISFVIQVSMPLAVAKTFTAGAEFLNSEGKIWTKIKGFSGQLAMSAIAIFISIGCPGANVYMLAANLHELPQLSLWWQDIFGTVDYSQFPRSYLTVTYVPEEKIFLPRNYAPYADMGDSLKVLIVGVLVHYLLVVYKGINLVVKLNEKKIIDEKKPVDKKDPAKPGNSNGIFDSFKSLLGYVYKDADTVKTKAQKAADAFVKKVKVTEQEGVERVKEISDLVQKLKDSYAGFDVGERKKALEDINKIFIKLGMKIGADDLKAAADGDFRP